MVIWDAILAVHVEQLLVQTASDVELLNIFIFIWFDSREPLDFPDKQSNHWNHHALFPVALGVIIKASSSSEKACCPTICISRPKRSLAVVMRTRNRRSLAEKRNL